MGFFDFFKKKNVPNDEITDNKLNEATQQFVEENQEKTEDIIDNAYEKAEEIKEQLEEKVEEIQEQLEEKVEEVKEQLEEKVEEVIEKTEDKTEDIINPKEEPLTDKESQQEESQKEEPQQEAKPEKKSFFAKIREGLSKTRENILSSVDRVVSVFTTIDEDLFEELEEALIMADIGVETSLEIINRLRQRAKAEKLKEVAEVKGAIIEIISEMLRENYVPFELKSPAVLLVIGVNGVGKTTTIGKITNNLKSEGKNVLLAAADTFRAAAIDQLEEWGKRNNTDVIKHQENSDPGAVVFDAVQTAKSRKADVLICDTAGRLHNKKNLMDELKKINKIITTQYPEAQLETFLVLDATTGQNALQQAKLFKEVCDITGLVLTKLDGTAKGGIVIAINNELKIPVRYIGVGEGIDDLKPFDADEFAKALF